MPLQATSGAASYDAFGGGVPFVPTYIEDVMSVWLYTGNGSTQTITNGIDLAGKGGTVFIKSRTNASGFPSWFDTLRGPLKRLQSSSTLAEGTVANSLTAFNSDGFSVGSVLSASSENFVGWTFRKAPKFFDVVTYTGNNTAGRTIAHNLGSVPGCIIVKCTSSSGAWTVYHRSPGATKYLILNNTDAETTFTGMWNNTEPTATEFTLGASGFVNASGATYVAYLFAHNAGGFGLTGTDNVISCGSFTTNGSGGVTGDVTLGYEPQWLLVKQTNASDNWYLWDTMRGFSLTNIQGLYPNLSAAEGGGSGLFPTATGFAVNNGTFSANGTFIYIAIRRGPMKVPTTGTSVFVPYAYAGSGAGTYTTGINQDLFFAKSRNSGSYVWNWYDRLRGPNLRLQSNATTAEASVTGVTAFNNTSMVFGASDGFSSASPFGGPYIGYAFTRAPGYFDEVCYTGTGVARTVAHNLAVVPELIITANRSSTNQWTTYCANVCTTNGQFLQLYTTDARQNSASSMWGTPFNGAPNMTSSAFSLGTDAYTNNSGANFVAYLFASCPGVSKVGSYTGNGSSQTINCGFTGGARFVLIRASSAAGQWRVYDSARGISAGNEPELFLNSTSAEQTVYDAIDPDSTGFIVNSNSANINDNGVTYIFLAIA